MVSRDPIVELQLIVDDLFRDKGRTDRRELYLRASADDALPGEVLTYLKEIPADRLLTQREMVDNINKIIQERGQSDRLGFLSSSGVVEPVEETPEMELAAEDETPLHTLEPEEEEEPDPHAPEFRPPREQ